MYWEVRAIPMKSADRREKMWRTIRSDEHLFFSSEWYRVLSTDDSRVEESIHGEIIGLIWMKTFFLVDGSRRRFVRVCVRFGLFQIHHKSDPVSAKQFEVRTKSTDPTKVFNKSDPVSAKQFEVRTKSTDPTKDFF
jgi:hypothetical protein